MAKQKEEFVQCAKEGVTFVIRNHEFTVAKSCGENTPYGNWICVSHKLVFSNQFEKDGHISESNFKGTPHVLAWNCPKHGPEVP